MMPALSARQATSSEMVPASNARMDVRPATPDADALAARRATSGAGAIAESVRRDAKPVTDGGAGAHLALTEDD